ncbi:MAG: DUF433 domain-containing protein [Ignavibacteriales bacterium]|nr:MAG: DUF433 domain-containing protein [Ignavibacteriales bacterium]
MDYKEIIGSDPAIMLGKPIIKGTRITVELIIKKLSEGLSPEEIIDAYPSLNRDQILAALAYTFDIISREETLAA